jgi:hypothetical protein
MFCVENEGRNWGRIVRSAFDGLHRDLPFFAAWAIPVVLGLVAEGHALFAGARRVSSGAGVYVLAVVFGTLHWTYVLLVVRFYRCPLGIWGYSWRGWLMGYVALVPFIVIGGAARLLAVPLGLRFVLVVLLLCLAAPLTGRLFFRRVIPGGRGAKTVALAGEG